MTPRLVADASVALKWHSATRGEPLAAEANLLLDRIVGNAMHALVPDLFWSEIADALWKMATRGKISAAMAAMSLDQLASLGLLTHSTLQLTADALDIATKYGHPVYDCIYVALARQLNIELVTADETLVRKLGSRFPVRWLGALS